MKSSYRTQMKSSYRIVYGQCEESLPRKQQRAFASVDAAIEGIRSLPDPNPARYAVVGCTRMGTPICPHHAGCGHLPLHTSRVWDGYGWVIRRILQEQHSAR